MRRSVLALRRCHVSPLPSSVRTPRALPLSHATCLFAPQQLRHSRRSISSGTSHDDSNNGGNSDRRNNNNNNGGGGGGEVALPRAALPPSDFPERSFLKCIEKEMEDEALRLDKEEGPPPPPPGWEIYHAPGTSVFYGRRWWVPPATKPTATAAAPRGVERHTIRVQLTTRDPSLDPECDVRGEHFPFSFFVQRVADNARTSDKDVGDHSSGANDSAEEVDERGLYEQSIEVRADFVEGELVIDNIVLHGTFRPSEIPAGATQGGAERDPRGPEAPSSPDGSGEEVHYNNVFGGYPGPNLDEVEEEVLDGVQAWLAERCIDDQFGEFVGQHSVWVEQMEYERWLRQLRDFVAA